MVVGVCCLLLCAAGCAGTTGNSLESFLREDVDLGFVQRIAVLPFENNTENKYAPGRIRDIVTTKMLTNGLFDVVDKGLVDSVFIEEALEKGAAIDTLTLKRLGQRLNVQALLIGSVDIVDDVKVGSVIFPEIAITLRLLEAQSGMILWQASGRESGESLAGRILGLAPGDSFKVTSRLVESMLATLPDVVE
jgi:TolB-like protein